MNKLLLPLVFFSTASGFAQENILLLTNTKTNKETIIVEGNKVLMAIKMARHDTKKKPLSIYKLSKNEMTDSVFVFTKGRIKTITDSSIIFAEKNSFFSTSVREINLGKINTLRKLSFGKQVVRTVTTVGGGLALGVALFYSYVAQDGNDEFLHGMFIAAGIGVVSTRFGKTKIPKKYLDKYKISRADE